MARRLGFKRSHKDTLRANDAAIRGLALMSGKPVPPEFLNNVPEKRTRAATDHAMAEAGVINDIEALLKLHPGVFIAWRCNSGSAVSASGAPVWFNRLVRKPCKLRLVDFIGHMRDGRPIAIEAKRRDWREPSDAREEEQAAYIAMIRSIGGVAGFARNVDEAKALLDG